MTAPRNEVLLTTKRSAALRRVVEAAANEFFGKAAAVTIPIDSAGVTATKQQRIDRIIMDAATTLGLFTSESVGNDENPWGIRYERAGLDRLTKAAT